MRISDIATFDGTIVAGDTEVLTVDTSDNEVTEVVALLDDGTAGNTPPTYDMVQKIELPTGTADDYRWYDEVTDETARSWSDPCFGQSFQSTFTNQSGADADYRIVLIALSE